MPAWAPVNEMARPPRAFTAIAVKAVAVCSPVDKRMSSSRSVGCGDTLCASFTRLSVAPAIAEMTATTWQPVRCACWFHKNSFLPRQPCLRCQNLLVAYHVDCSTRFCDCGPRLFPACRISDSNCGCDRFGFFNDAVVKNRRCTCRLKSNHHWQF